MNKKATVKSVETISCDAGWRNYHFVKIVTQDGIVGWTAPFAAVRASLG